MFFIRYYGNFSRILLLLFHLIWYFCCVRVFASFFFLFFFFANLVVAPKYQMPLSAYNDESSSSISINNNNNNNQIENGSQNITRNAIYKLLQNNIFHFVTLSFLCKNCTFIWWRWNTFTALWMIHRQASAHTCRLCAYGYIEKL